MRTTSVCSLIVAGALLVACGAPSANPSAAVITTDAAVELDPATADIALLPVSMYSSASCDVVTTVERDVPTGEYDTVIFDNFAAAGAGVDAIVAGTVVAVNEPLLITPSGLPDEFLAAVGAASADDLAWEGVPIVVQVDTVISGSAPDEIVVFESGCLGVGASELTTVGTAVILMVDQSSPTEGPSALYGGTHRSVDVVAVGADGTLIAGRRALVRPTKLPFLIGLTLDEAVALPRN